jgi:hypothetical protein
MARFAETCQGVVRRDLIRLGIGGNLAHHHALLAAPRREPKATARATDLLPVIAEVRAAGVATLSGIAKALTARGVPTPSGRGVWSPATVMRLDRRVQAA